MTNRMRNTIQRLPLPPGYYAIRVQNSAASRHWEVFDSPDNTDESYRGNIVIREDGTASWESNDYAVEPQVFWDLKQALASITESRRDRFIRNRMEQQAPIIRKQLMNSASWDPTDVHIDTLARAEAECEWHKHNVHDTMKIRPETVWYDKPGPGAELVVGRVNSTYAIGFSLQELKDLLAAIDRFLKQQGKETE